MRRSTVACALLALSMFGQAGKPPVKTSGYVIGSLLLKDEGCAKDALKVTQSSGLERRKLIADLIAYGCAEKLRDDLFYTGTSSVSAPLSQPGRKAYSVYLLYDNKLSNFAAGSRVDYGNEDIEKRGWVLDSDFLLIPEPDMWIMVAKRKEQSARKE